VLTKVAEPVDVAYIYPFSIRKHKASSDPLSFWTVLHQFWSQDRVDAWYNAIFSEGTEVVYNLMCLGPSAYKYHERAYFALEPKEISNDKKRLMVKFYWLPRYQHSDEVDILSSPLIPEDGDGENHGVGLWNFSTEKQIYSGDEIYLETNDPERLPLPDWRILEMQWILHRVTVLSAAAEPRDDFGEDTDDDWDMALEDLEAEDEWFARTPSPEMSLPPPKMSSSPQEMFSPPPARSLPLSSLLSSSPPCYSFFPSAKKEVEFGIAITTADESIVSNAGEAIDWEAEVKEGTSTGEENGKRRADIDAVAKFEERESEGRMVLSSGKY
jgi:hypothetical protein